MNKILIFGKNGQVSWELKRSLACLGVVSSFGSDEVNLSQPDAIRSVINQVQPAIIVNAAAYTAVDKAESEPELAMAVNGVAPGVMAEEAKSIGALLVHFSTDYVYEGQASLPYIESAAFAPQGVYGKTKLAGDQAIEAVDSDYIIFRTSWVYGARGNNFLLTMKRLMSEREALSIVSDQVGSPTWSRVIADVTAQVIGKLGAGNRTAKKGVYHLSCEGEGSWFDFAALIRDYAHLDCQLSPITTKNYPTPATRPAYSVMSGSKLYEVFGLRCPSWQEALALCMETN